LFAYQYSHIEKNNQIFSGEAKESRAFTNNNTYVLVPDLMTVPNRD